MTARDVKRNVTTIGGGGADYTSIHTWEAGEQGVHADIRVAILTRQHAEDLNGNIDQLAGFLDAPTLFLTDAGTLLAYVDEGKVERLTEDWISAFDEPSSTHRTDEAIDGFVLERFGVVENETYPEVRLIVRNMSAAFARLVAENPNVLDDLEWRQLEQTMAEVFDGLGFSVVLTPPAKDGGKDLILSCQVTTGNRTYVVEVKHWVCGKRVGPKEVDRLLKIVVLGARGGGLILSSSGFTSPAYEALASIERLHVHAGSRTSILTLCKLYAADHGRVLSPADVWTELTEGRWMSL